MTPSDLELIRSLAAGRSGAGEALEVRLQCIPRMVAALARRYGYRLAEDELGDVCQETVRSVLAKLDRFEGRSSLETWVFRFCVNELHSYMRKSRRLPVPWSDVPPGDRREPEHRAQWRLPEEEQLQRMMRGLTPREQQVVVLRHVDMLSVRETAEHLGVSESTVKTSYVRAIEKLRVTLGPAAVGEDRS